MFEAGQDRAEAVGAVESVVKEVGEDVVMEVAKEADETAELLAVTDETLLLGEDPLETLTAEMNVLPAAGYVSMLFLSQHVPEPLPYDPPT